MTPEFTFPCTFSLVFSSLAKVYGNVEHMERSVITNILTMDRHGLVVVVVGGGGGEKERENTETKEEDIRRIHREKMEMLVTRVRVRSRTSVQVR
jgi:uridylate kinase